MSKVVRHSVVALSLAGGLLAQQADLAARRLFYQDNSPEVVFKATTVANKTPEAPKPQPPKPKPVAQSTPPANSQQAQAAKNQQLEKIQQALREAATTALNGTSVKPAANLGVRYNVLKVEPGSNKRTEVSPDTVFRSGECAGIRIQPNRGGFLYVFNEASSGKWQALIPSEEAAEDSNIVRAYNLMDVPDKYCFEMDDKPGTERLLIVVTDKPEDIWKLNESLKKPANLEIASNNNNGLSEQVSAMAKLQGRDIKLTRVGATPVSQGEAPYSTYLVNAAATTNDRLVLEIKLKHGK